MSFISAFSRGYAAAEAAHGRPRGSGMSCDAPRAPAKASPIKFGYHYDRRTGRVGGPNPYGGEKHIVLLGLNGAGKQTRILTELYMTKRRRSGVFLDIKGTGAFQCADAMREFSKVGIICPFPVLGLKDDGCNPIARFDPDSKDFPRRSRAVIDSVIDEEVGASKHFSERSLGFSTAFVMWEVQCAKREGRTPSLLNVRLTITQPDVWEVAEGPNGKPIKRLVTGLNITIERMIAEGGPIISSLVSNFLKEAGKDEKASVISTVERNTEFLLDPDIAECLAKDGCNLEQLRDVESSIFIVVEPDKLELARRFIRLLLSCAVNAHFRPGKYDTIFVLDEMRAAVGNLPIITKNWQVVREYGIIFLAVWQSLEFAKGCLGDEWRGKLAQAGIVVALGPPGIGDETTAEWMSVNSGETTVLVGGVNVSAGTGDGNNDSAGDSVSDNGTSRNNGLGRNRSTNKGGGFSLQQVKRRALLAQELRSMRPGEGRIWVSGEGEISIPFFAPNYWKRSAAWVAKVKPNPLFNG